jgi:hypothetical protein
MSVGPLDVEVRPQAAPPVHRLDHRPLVLVEVGLDEPPQRGAVGVDHRRAADDAQQGPDAGPDQPGVAGDQPQLRRGIGLVEDGPVPGPVGHRGVVGIALEQQVPQRPQHARLGGEGRVDGLERDARVAGDGLHRRGHVAVALEQPLGGVEDRLPGDRRLRTAAETSG